MAETFSIKISNLDQIKTALSNYPAAAKKYFSRAINAALVTLDKNAVDSNFKFKTPRESRSGLLQQSFGEGLHQATESNLTGSTGPTVAYAKYVEFGTAAHLIKAINAKVLANKKSGQVFGPIVHHPGSAANPFMERIIGVSQSEIDNTFTQALDLVMQTLQVI